MPIYNEIKNLETCVDKVRDALNQYDYEIIIVDDNSPDGSGHLADQLSERFSNLKVLHRSSRRGLGTAYKEGFHYCKGDLIVSIDSDLSHDPDYLPLMIERISEHDVVIGSRLCKGGKILGRHFLRDVFTHLANFIIRLSVNTTIHDWTSGYRLYRRPVWEKVMPDVHCNKWDFQFESLFLSQYNGASIAEIPITFHERAGGSSKFNTLDAIIFLRSYLRILLSRKKN